MIEECLPGGEPGDRQRGGRDVVDIGRERGQIAGLDRRVLGQRAVAAPVGETEHPLAHGQPGGAVPQLGHDPGQLVPRHTRRTVPPRPVGPSTGPGQLARSEPGSVDAHDHVVLRGMRMGQIGESQPADAGVAVLDSDGSHEVPL